MTYKTYILLLSIIACSTIHAMESFGQSNQSKQSVIDIPCIQTASGEEKNDQVDQHASGIALYCKLSKHKDDRAILAHIAWHGHVKQTYAPCTCDWVGYLAEANLFINQTIRKN